MTLPFCSKIKMEFGLQGVEAESTMGVVLGNVTRMINRLPRALVEDRQQEVKEICERLTALAEAVDESRLATLIEGFPDLAGDADINERERRLQALDMLAAEWQIP